MDDLTRLLVAARDGDRGALGAVVRRAQPDVWRFAMHLVGPDEADDVTQDVFLRAYRSLPGFHAESSGRTWLLAITRRACADAVRHTRRRRRLHERLVSHHVQAVAPDPDGALGLDHLVVGLDEDRRLAFVLTQVLGCSYSETAEICDTAVGTIRSRVARAHADLLEQVRRGRHRMNRRALLRATAGLGLVLGFVVVTAGPAAAHGVGGLDPTNYRTTVKGIEPPVPGLHVRAIDLGASVELRNDTAHEVTVVGYQGEPYLRIGPRGTWENTRSPAVFLNRSHVPTREAPHDQYDAEATPEWRKVSDEPVASWHDHRTHWMGTTDPPSVRRDPGRTHVVIADWTIPLLDQGRKITVTGDALWVPGPSPWPWVLGALALAIAVVALCRTRAWVSVMQISLAVLIATETIHVIGAWQASTASIGSRTLASIYSIGGIIVSALALVWLRRRDAWAATPAVLIAGLFVLVAGGLADVTTLTRSQLPTSLPDPLGRLTVTIALGLGAGLVVAAASRFRAPPAPTRTEPTAPVPTLVP